jgi:ribosome maturation factor RimP
MTNSDRLHTDIEQRLTTVLPEVELLACERAGGDRLRLFIDHPDGVSLELCERVTRELGDLLSAYSLEVSSPGPQRPLTKPDHFRRFLGRRARVRTREALGRSADRSSTGRAPDPEFDGHKSFTGELVGATDAEVTVAVDPEAALVSIPYTDIDRSNLLERRGEEKR